MANAERSKTDSRRWIAYGPLVGLGGEGMAYEGRDERDGERVVVKIFRDEFADQDTITRIRYLTGLRLFEECPVIASPYDCFTKNGRIGHCAKWVGDRSLLEALENPDFCLLEALQLSLALTRALHVLHEKQVAQGDLHPENVRVSRSGDVIKVWLIDLDNFNSPETAPPRMLGHNLYVAPELRKAMAAGKPRLPDIFTDRFELGVLLHEILLLRHPAAGFDGDPDIFSKTMQSGVWQHDPLGTTESAVPSAGYPTKVLDPGLARLFRRAFRKRGRDRPTPGDWQKALQSAFQNVMSCDQCFGQYILDSGKTSCPTCGQKFLPLKLRTPTTEVIFDAATTIVGRQHFGEEPTVSARHATFRRVGPELRLKAWGSNSTFRWSGTDWIRLPNDCRILLQVGDKLRFADQEATIVSS